MIKISINLLIKNIFKSIQKTYNWKQLLKVLSKNNDFIIDDLHKIEFDKNHIYFIFNIKNKAKENKVDKKNIIEKTNQENDVMELINKIIL